MDSTTKHKVLWETLTKKQLSFPHMRDKDLTLLLYDKVMEPWTLEECKSEIMYIHKR